MSVDKNLFYESPNANVVEIKTQAIICQSGGNTQLEEQILDENDFEDV